MLVTYCRAISSIVLHVISKFSSPISICRRDSKRFQSECREVTNGHKEQYFVGSDADTAPEQSGHDINA
jgi:hypothetical protein